MFLCHISINSIFDTGLEGSVPENAAPGTPVLTLNGHDRDPEPYNAISYSVMGDRMRPMFRIDQHGSLNAF